MILVTVVAMVLCALMFFQVLQRNKEKGRDIIYFRLACVICVLGLSMLLAQRVQALLGMLQMLMRAYSSTSVLIVGLFCLHVYIQTRHKRPSKLMIMECIILPTIVLVANYLAYELGLEFLQYGDIIGVISALLVFIMTLQMVQFVVSQMARSSQQRRRQSYLLLLATLFVTVIPIIAASAGSLVSDNIKFQNDLLLFSQVIALLLFYFVQSLAPAEESIITSYGFVMENLSTIVLMLDSKTRILDWNEKLNVSTLPSPSKKELFAEYRERIVREGYCTVSPHNESIIAIIQGETEMQYLVSVNDATNNGEVIGYLVEISEVTPLYAIISYFREAATMDHLTQLHSRNAYMRVIPLMMQAENVPLLVMVGDVNGLKRINDLHGHLEGDKLLVSAADMLRKAAPENAFIARLGGDEFVMLLPKGDAAAAESFIARLDGIRADMKENAESAPNISWGYTVIEDAGENYDDAFARADTMMYDKKSDWYREQNVERRVTGR